MGGSASSIEWGGQQNKSGQPIVGDISDADQKFFSRLSLKKRDQQQNFLKHFSVVLKHKTINVILVNPIISNLKLKCPQAH
jgi:hypothetical protein